MNKYFLASISNKTLYMTHPTPTSNLLCQLNNIVNIWSRGVTPKKTISTSFSSDFIYTRGIKGQKTCVWGKNF